MRKLVILFFVGLILASVLLPGLSLAGEDKGNNSQGEVKKGEGYQLAPADNRSQFISIFLILVIMALTI